MGTIGLRSPVRKKTLSRFNIWFPSSSASELHFFVWGKAQGLLTFGSGNQGLGRQQVRFLLSFQAHETPRGAI